MQGTIEIDLSFRKAGAIPGLQASRTSNRPSSIPRTVVLPRNRGSRIIAGLWLNLSFLEGYGLAEQQFQAGAVWQNQVLPSRGQNPSHSCSSPRGAADSQALEWCALRGSNNGTDFGAGDGGSRYGFRVLTFASPPFDLPFLRFELVVSLASKPGKGCAQVTRGAVGENQLVKSESDLSTPLDSPRANHLRHRASNRSALGYDDAIAQGDGIDGFAIDGLADIRGFRVDGIQEDHGYGRIPWDYDSRVGYRNR